MATVKKSSVPLNTKKIVKTAKAAAPAAASVKKPVKVATKKVVKKVLANAKTTAMAAIKPCKVRFTATDILNKACESAGIERKQGKAFIEWQQRYIMACLKKGGIGSAKMFGLNIKAVHVPAKKMPAIKKGTMIKNPFKGGIEEAHVGRAAFTKPGKIRVKAIALKAFKDGLYN